MQFMLVLQLFLLLLLLLQSIVGGGGADKTLLLLISRCRAVFFFHPSSPIFKPGSAPAPRRSTRSGGTSTVARPRPDRGSSGSTSTGTQTHSRSCTCRSDPQTSVSPLQVRSQICLIPSNLRSHFFLYPHPDASATVTDSALLDAIEQGKTMNYQTTYE